MVHTMCAILDYLVIEYGPKIKTLSEDEQKIAYEAFFIFAGLWGIGGPVGGGQDDEKDFKDFSALWKTMAKVKFPE